MPKDEAQLTDEVWVELNPEDDGPEFKALEIPPIPERPADDASREDWVEYAVALGADREFVTSQTTHYVEAKGRDMGAPALSDEALRELASKLGG